MADRFLPRRGERRLRYNPYRGGSLATPNTENINEVVTFQPVMEVLNVSMNALSMVNRIFDQTLGSILRTASYTIQSIFVGTLERRRLAPFRELQDQIGVRDVPDSAYGLFRRWDTDNQDEWNQERGFRTVDPSRRDERMNEWDNARRRRLM
jgi:hypothetical protein